MICLEFFTSNVTFIDGIADPPQPKDPVVINNLAIGQPVDVRINFTANPRPVRLYWELEDGTQVNVEPFPFDTERRSTAGERFEVFQLRQTVSIPRKVVQSLDGFRENVHNFPTDFPSKFLLGGQLVRSETVDQVIERCG